MKSRYDAVVVGSGPNGLAAAIMLAQAGRETVLIEGSSTAGGGMRSSPLTLPGFIHDVCSAAHPLGVASPFFRSLGLERHGLVWLESPAPLVHLLDDGTPIFLERSVEATAAQFGHDADAYRTLMAPFVERFGDLARDVLTPLRLPRHPSLLARFGFSAVQSMIGLASKRFAGAEAPALLASIAAHAMIPLEWLASASFALVLGVAGHAVGWPLALGGSQAIADALVAHFRSIGGELVVDHPVRSIDELPAAKAYVFDVSPKQLVAIAGDELSPTYTDGALRFRYGPGAFKVDWALSGPIPWKDARVSRATTVHLSGDIDAIAAATRAPHAGRVAGRPFVLMVQPSIVDPSRAPPGKGTAWAYCHVPSGSTTDLLPTIEARIEEFAPGFRDLVLARSTRNASELERYNPNYVGGDINSGLSNFGQLFLRPMARFDPYTTSAPDIFLCSSSTPPGGGVHGMCGYWAARSVLRRLNSPRRT